MKHSECNGELKTANSTLLKIEYCMDCGRFEIHPKECVHNYLPVNFRLENGGCQIRKYCTLCFAITSQSEKADKYDVGKLPKWSLSEYKTGLDIKLENDKLLFSDILNELKNIRIEKFSEKRVSNQEEYNEYLKSDHWKKLREAVLKRDNYECQICFNPAEQVHHLTYQHRGEEYKFELVSLCADCHEKYYHS